MSTTPRPARRRPVEPDIARLLADRGIEDNADLLAGAIDAILRAGVDRAGRGELKIVTRAVREMRYAFRVFAAYRDRPKITVFGSARTPPDDPAYQAGVAFGKAMAKSGWMVITGAGGGIMEAGHVGAGAAMSFGLAIRLPFEQSCNPVIEGDGKLITFRHFFTRKLFFVKEARAICLMPGGFGTHDEGFEALTLIQTGKAPPMPIVLLEEPGGTYWQGWREFVQTRLADRGYVDEADLSLVKITDDVETARREVTGFYRRYHSSRYVDERLVIRLHRPLEREAVVRLTNEFEDILLGSLELSAALPPEAEEARIAHLPRLVVPFNRRSFGRLRQLIDALNAEP